MATIMMSTTAINKAEQLGIYLPPGVREPGDRQVFIDVPKDKIEQLDKHNIRYKRVIGYPKVPILPFKE